MTKDDYLSRIDDMLGEKTVNGIGDSNISSISESLRDTDSKPGIHPLWKLIDTWGGTMYLKARQLTLWRDEDE